ncbi:MAG: hypothetical protein FWC13_03900 [Oscillospiraceae bacterium]|nr:hypothetical protein [Oscillospiraceae bacterium]
MKTRIISLLICIILLASFSTPSTLAGDFVTGDISAEEFAKLLDQALASGELTIDEDGFIHVESYTYFLYDVIDNRVHEAVYLEDDISAEEFAALIEKALASGELVVDEYGTIVLNGELTKLYPEPSQINPLTQSFPFTTNRVHGVYVTIGGQRTRVFDARVATAGHHHGQFFVVEWHSVTSQNNASGVSNVSINSTGVTNNGSTRPSIHFSFSLRSNGSSVTSSATFSAT